MVTVQVYIVVCDIACLVQPLTCDWNADTPMAWNEDNVSNQSTVCIISGVGNGCCKELVHQYIVLPWKSNFRNKKIKSVIS